MNYYLTILIIFKGAKVRQQLKDQLVLLAKNCPLKVLAIPGSNRKETHLKSDLIPFLNALETNLTLNFLDITGNKVILSNEFCLTFYR